MSADPEDYAFKHRNGEVLVKTAGSVNGNGFVLDSLHDCEVYILDHTSQVQVDDCVNCKIFIGPTDGSVFIRDCRDCTLCVAARQLRTRDCRELHIALYCATQPSIETSTGIVFSCWRGAYPGLTAHFAAARLDPARNTWAQVYDFNSKDDLGAEHYRLDESVQPWWTPPPPYDGTGAGAGAAPPDCPVPAPDGSLYGGGRTAPPPKSPSGSSPALPSRLPPSPGRAAAHDEEVELEDEDEEEEEIDGDGVVTLLPPGTEDGGRSFVRPAQPSPRPDPHGDGEADTAAAQGPGGGAEGGADGAFSFAAQQGNAFGGADPTAQAAPPQPAADASLVPPPLLPQTSDSWLDEASPDAAGAAAAAADSDPFGAPSPAAPATAVSAAPAAIEGGLFGDAPAPAAAAAPHWAGAEAGAGPGLGAGSAAAAAPLPAAATAVAGGAGGGDARAAWRAGNAAALAAAAAAERGAREEERRAAAARLASLQQSRDALLKKRHVTHRSRAEAEGAGLKGGAAAAGGGGFAASASAGWAAVAALVDLTHGSAGAAAGASGHAARDVSRYRQLIIALKSGKH